MDFIRGAVQTIIHKTFGTKSERDIKKLGPVVDQINSIYADLAQLSDEQIQEKTAEFRQRLEEGETVDDLMPEAFAVVKEACRRHRGQSWMVVGQKIQWDMVPFDVQLMGGVVLYQGKIAEMQTGEGKTLVAILPLYLYGLTGKGAHLITVNDYLARRDSEWVGAILRWLGLSVGTIHHDMDTESRRAAYLCDVTYGTNNEFGFDYLRDNMVRRLEDKVQRKHHFAIVDEVDSVLIDEARTPLIISGPVQHSTQQFDRLRPGVEALVKKQGTLVSRFLDEAEQLIGSDDRDEQYQGLVRLLQVQRGAPKHERLIKLLGESDMKKRMLSVEADFMREKRAHVLDEDLLYSIDEKGHSVALSDEGRETLAPKKPEVFILPDIAEAMGKVDTDESLSPKERIAAKEAIHKAYAEKSEILGNVQQLLRAYSLYEKDKEYVVQDGKVVIVDEFTGRLMPGRRFSEGLHQALEAKERVKVGGETQTFATITIQNYFRMYETLAGMTGTAETEAGEFWTIYGLDVVVVPTNVLVNRSDYEDVIYRTKRDKYNAILDEIEELHEAGRPILVGTITVEVSETLSRMLKRRGINHHVLNAKYHQQEAEIIAGAGQKGAVTIATNMAGRGTDIKLGEGVITGDVETREDGTKDKSELEGGLHIIGTERHESRRIDRQLRGRAGRQGDPGSSRFYLSLEDDLMRLFAPERLAGLMEKLGEEGEVITHPFVTKAIERAQKRVEGHNFSIREHLLKFDDVMNQQREVVYTLRDEILERADMNERVQEMIEAQIRAIVDRNIDTKRPRTDWDLGTLAEDVQTFLLGPIQKEELNDLSYEELQEHLIEAARKTYAERETLFGDERMREVERQIFMAVIDEKWRDHLYEVDQVRSGINLRAYGQKDPLLEYKSETFAMFEQMMGEIDADTARLLFRVMPAPPQPTAALSAASRRQEPAVAAAGSGSLAPPPTHGSAGQFQEQHSAASAFAPTGAPAPAGAGGGRQAAPAGAPAPGAPPSRPKTVTRDRPKIGRNEPCPCGSGKKYKKCCGASAA